VTYPLTINYENLVAISKFWWPGNNFSSPEKYFHFSKAFDKVPHQRLIHKLNYYGIRDKNLNWITYFYEIDNKFF